MVKIYFDESRNTGEISLSATKLNYSEQRYFILLYTRVEKFFSTTIKILTDWLYIKQ